MPHLRRRAEPDALTHTLRLAPALPAGWDHATLRNFPLGESAPGQPVLATLAYQRSGNHLEADVTTPTPITLCLGTATAPVTTSRYGGPARPSPTRPTAARNRPLLVLEPGDRVTHDKYGLGRVEEVSGMGESAMSLIDFGSAGRVKLMHNHAPVHKL